MDIRHWKLEILSMLPINEILEKISHKDKKNTLPSGENFLSLVIKEKIVQAGIWEFSEVEGKSVAFGSWETWRGENSEELIVAADASIATAVAKMPEISSSQPTKVILGLPNYWVEENAIRKGKLEILQAVCKKLLLKPLGFVVNAEAIAHLLKKEEGGLPSLILVNIDEGDITVSLISQGKFLGSKAVGRSNSLALDLEEGLSVFNFEGALPGRIMLFGAGDLEDLKQSLISYPWTAPTNEKKLGFLQIPKIEIADQDFETAAVILAGSNELGGKTSPVDKISEKPSLIKEEESEDAIVEEVVIENSKQDEPFLKENFGFVENEDVLVTRPPEQEVVEDASQKLTEEEFKTEKPPEEPETLQREIFIKPPKFKKFKFSFNLHPVAGLIKKVFTFFLRKGFLMIIPVVLILLGGVFFAMTGLTKASVKLFVQPKTIEKEFDFTVSSKVGLVDATSMTLPAKEVSVEVSSTKTTTVNGKKTVGDKAKGELVMYNGTDKAKILVKGSVIKDTSSLKFILTQEAVVPAMTSDLNSTPPVYKWGEKKVSAEAADIGVQYNIAANSSLNLESAISSSSSFLIKNPSAFSGGTSREIQAVSKEDRTGLQQEIAKELENKAREEIKSKIAPTDHLLADSVLLKSRVDRFNGEVGDEASSLILEGKYSYSALFFKADDLKILVDKVISPLVADGYSRLAENEYQTLVLKDKERSLYTISLNEKIIPNIDIGIAQQLKAKKISTAEAYLKNISNISGVEISISPKIFSLLKILPTKEKNIVISVEAL